MISFFRILAVLVCLGAPSALGQGTPQRLLDAFAIEAGTVQRLDLPPSAGQPFQVEVTLAGASHTLDLRPHDLRGPEYRLLVEDAAGVWPAPTPASVTYRGAAAGMADSVAAASLVAGQLQALVRLERDGPWWMVQPVTDVDPAADMAQHVVYATYDNLPTGGVCGVDDLVSTPVPSGKIGLAGQALCELAIDADVEFFQKNGSSVTATEADIMTVMNMVDLIFQADTSVAYLITTIIVRTAEPDPYTTSDYGPLLDEFANEWQTNQTGVVRDVAHLFTGKNLSGSVIGVAWLSSICSTGTGYGLSESLFTSNLSSRTGLTAHELGHNWSAGHCDGASDCWIMCSGLGGCGGDLSQFGVGSRGAIVSFANFAWCLDEQAPLDGLLMHEPFSYGLTGGGSAPLDGQAGGEGWEGSAWSAGGLAWVVSPINSRLYAKTESAVTWSQAEAQAVAAGGHLATVRSQAEHDWIWSTFGPGSLWIGMSDQVSEGSFVWSSGEPVGYSNWAPGEPNNAGGAEDYGHMWSAYADGRWNDHTGSATYPGILERDPGGIGGGFTLMNPSLASPGFPHPGSQTLGLGSQASRAVGGEGASARRALGLGLNLTLDTDWFLSLLVHREMVGAAPAGQRFQLLDGTKVLASFGWDAAGSWFIGDGIQDVAGAGTLPPGGTAFVVLRLHAEAEGSDQAFLKAYGPGDRIAVDHYLLSGQGTGEFEWNVVGPAFSSFDTWTDLSIEPVGAGTVLHVDEVRIGTAWRKVVKGAGPVVYGDACGGLSMGWSEDLPSLGSAGFTLGLAAAPPGAPLSLAFGPSDTSWNGVPLPLDLGFLGAPGCWLLTGLVAAAPAGPADALGTAALTVAIPALPALTGAVTYVQWLVLDPAANPLGLTLSQGLLVKILP